MAWRLFKYQGALLELPMEIFAELWRAEVKADNLESKVWCVVLTLDCAFTSADGYLSAVHGKCKYSSTGISRIATFHTLGAKYRKLLGTNVHILRTEETGLNRATVQSLAGMDRREI